MPDQAGPEAHVRKTVSVSKKAAYAAGGLTLVSAFSLMGDMSKFFYSKDAGQALGRDVTRLELTLNQNKVELLSAIREVKIDNDRNFNQILNTLKEDHEATFRLINKYEVESAFRDRRIENLELITRATRPKSK